MTTYTTIPLIFMSASFITHLYLKGNAIMLRLTDLQRKREKYLPYTKSD